MKKQTSGRDKLGTLAPKFAELNNELKERLSSAIDSVSLRNDYEKLANIVGEADMDELNEAVKNNFLICTKMESFLQSIADQWLACLLYRDRETSKKVFQLLTEVKDSKGNLCGVIK